ncbi:MAG: glycosyl hydrolase [Planctomycetia bacterium]|nr:glycosyl hydrolase [Planctomycetia bacterium]
MPTRFLLLLLISTTVWGESMLDLANPDQLSRSQGAGYPSFAEDTDIASGFAQPPAGYGEVPFWWWTGDPLDKERLKWQLEELHKKGISGVQVNYAHQDKDRWPTYPNTPEIFSDAWWDFYSFTSAEANRLGMGIGLSTYTLDWPGAKNLFRERVYNAPEFYAKNLTATAFRNMKKGETFTLSNSEENEIAVGAYPTVDGKITGRGKPLEPGKPFTAETDCVLWRLSWSAQPGTLNPMHPDSGKRVIEKFFQPFVEHNAGKTHQGLNYFFNDELRLGVPGYAWCDDFAKQFQAYKGYSLFTCFPALFTEMGDLSPKVRMDFRDVQMQLTEERYFKPIFHWHYDRGMIFGCDNNGRGLNPAEYHDYFRACRWYTAPGHDTPGGGADFIKGKVSSSIASLYRRPRVWLEGYHSLGWGATPNRLMAATNENYVYGCTLLNLHGLYYTTHGSHWEWAPPCYHFRMPYWKHMGTFLKYFERLSYVMSQGTWVSDIAVMYPTSPHFAGLEENQQEATKQAFDAARKIYATGRDITFLDDQSLLRAEIRDGKLCVSGMAFSVYVLPGVEAIRWDVLRKLRAFQEAGGVVICLGNKPRASDRAGANDPELDKLADALFAGQKPLEACLAALPQDVKGPQPVKYLHRRVGLREVYLVMGAAKNSEHTFRAVGIPELWDAMTGKISPMVVTRVENGSTTVVMPRNAGEATLVVFRPGTPTVGEPPQPVEWEEKVLSGPWQFRLLPTMDNRWGDFRLPVTDDNRILGAEARWVKLVEGDRTRTVSCGFGTQFVREDGTPYAFSWRWGIEGDPGHQGYHGLKENVTGHFIALGAKKKGLNETLYVEENPPKTYTLTTAVRYRGTATIQSGGNLPSEVLLDGKPLPADARTVELNGNLQTLTLKYSQAGRGFWFLEKGNAPRREITGENSDLPPAEPSGTPLAMPWYTLDVVPFIVPHASHATFRFAAPAGLKGFVLTVPECCSTPPDADGFSIVETPAKLPKTRRFVAVADAVREKASEVSLNVVLPEEIEGGAYFVEPVAFQTETGTTDKLFDWSAEGTGLETYSGGAVYTQTLTLSKSQAERVSAIDLGHLTATAEVRVNGKTVAVLVAAPWNALCEGYFQEGENRLEIEVYNTLASHFRTIPSRYRGDPRSAGLLGPVTLKLRKESAEYSCMETPDGVVLTRHGTPVWKLHIPQEPGKPYISPLCLPDGRDLTWVRPPDHTWHLGLWFSWKYLNGVNYWEPSDGITQVVRRDVQINGPACTVRLWLKYFSQNAPDTTVLTEERTLLFSAPNEKGAYSLESHHLFTAGTNDVLIDRTPPHPHGGGYAGWTLRMPPLCSSFLQTCENGGENMASIREKPAQWIDLRDPQNGQGIRFTILQGTENTRFYAQHSPTYCFWNPCPVLTAPITLPAGKKLALSYKIDVGM